MHDAKVLSITLGIGFLEVAVWCSVIKSTSPAVVVGMCPTLNIFGESRQNEGIQSGGGLLYYSMDMWVLVGCFQTVRLQGLIPSEQKVFVCYLHCVIL